ncbi:hypothetical protein MKZ38_003858 [Zalerion maritima]|uniref:Lipid droplet-associated hydrolase n=1 Tax=Zalerion maritima TaxID=339359 RepID=A0AAD5WS29_9PEZI|nr:hypothetical protein MKZ38_003858 [Zalerion maritima]
MTRRFIEPMSDLHYPCPSPAGKTKHVLVYFIPGNPGFVDYYDPFLVTLRNLIDGSEGTHLGISFHIAGRNLFGFDDQDHEPFSTSSPPHDLESQIINTAKHLSSLKVLRSSENEAETPYDAITLIGHSVGSYITMELFHRHHTGSDEVISELPLHSAILLFPTVTHIAKSPSGKKLLLLKKVPLVEQYSNQIAKGILWCIPDMILRGVLRNVLGMSEHGADVTYRFLRSRDAIWQALHMGVDEMETIAEEKWAESMWEALRGDEEGKHDDRVPKFFFYFAKTDHWVDEDERDQFIARRKVLAGRTRVEICEKGIPHSFPIHHGEVMAEKVKMWIDEIATTIAGK